MVHGKHLLSAAYAALVFTAPLAAQQAPVTSVTLTDAIQRARLVSPTVVAAVGNIRSAELSVRSATWSLLPALTVNPTANLNFSNGQSRLDPITGEIISGNVRTPTYQFGASATYTIFDGFGRSYTLKQQRANEQAANVGLVTSRFASDYTTTVAFFTALSGKQQLEVSQKNVDAAEGQLKLAAAKLHAGSATRSDSLSALGSFLQARLGLLSAQNNLVGYETSLGRLVGVAGRVAAVDDSAFYRPPVLFDTTAIRQEAMSNAPSIKSAEASLLAQQQAYRSTKAAYLPTLTASAAQSWTGNWGTPSPQSSSSNTGLISRRNLNLAVSFNPWTNYARETTVERASIQITNAEVTLADQRNVLAASLNTAFAALATAQETINVSAASVAAGEENMRVVMERYRTGVATITEVLAAQQQLTTAQASQVSARYSYLNAKAQLEQILGRKL